MLDRFVFDDLITNGHGRSASIRPRNYDVQWVKNTFLKTVEILLPVTIIIVLFLNDVYIYYVLLYDFRYFSKI